jgi:hypothetical protein
MGGMQATIIYPKEITFNFNIPCISASAQTSQEISDFLALLEGALCQHTPRLLQELQIRPIAVGDLLILHFDTPVYMVRDRTVYHEISRDEFLSVQRLMYTTRRNTITILSRLRKAGGN